MAATKNIGGISVSITATTDKFVKGMNIARRTLTGFSKSIGGVVFSMKGLAAALTGGAAVGMMTKFTKDAFNSIDALGELSDKLGVSTENLAGLQLAAAEAGIDNSLLEKSLVKLSNTMGMSGDKALRAWIEKTSTLSTQQEKLAAATAMFGTRGSSMVRFLNGGVEALDEAQKAAEGTGWALSRNLVAGVERALDAFGRFKWAVSGIFAQMAADLAPYVEILSTKAFNMLATNGAGKGIGSMIANSIIEMTKFVANSIQSMVGGVLDFVAEFKSLLHSFRQSTIGGAMGAGYEKGTYRNEHGMLMSKSVEGALGVAAARRRADEFNAKPRWGDGLQQFADESRKQLAAQAASQASEMMRSQNIAALARVAAPYLQKAQGFAGKAFSDLAGLRANGADALFSKIASSIKGNGAAMLEGATSMGRGSLSFAESGSADSYRQQAAIRKQGENIQKKQLDVQKEMRDGIKKIAATAPSKEIGLA